MAALQPELGACIGHYKAAQAAERQEEERTVALGALEARISATVPDGLEHDHIPMDRAGRR